MRVAAEKQHRQRHAAARPAQRHALLLCHQPLDCHQHMHGSYTHSHGRWGYGAQERLAPAAAARHVCYMAFAVAAWQLSMLCLPRSLTSLLAGEFGYTVCGRVGNVSIESQRHFQGDLWAAVYSIFRSGCYTCCTKLPGAVFH